jgi:cation-transporting ATPase 13A2
MATEFIFTKYYGGPIDSVFSPDQLERPQDDDASFEDTVVSSYVLH